MLGRALPELEDSLKVREDQVGLDATAAYRLRSVEQLRLLDADDPLLQELRRVDDLDAVLLALLAVDATDGAPDRVRVAKATAERVGLDPSRVRRVVALAEDGDQLLWAAAHRPSGLTESAVLPLVTHLETPDRGRGVYAIAALRNTDAERWERDRLRQLHDLIQAVLGDTGLTGTGARSLVAERRQDALALAGPSPSPGLVKRIEDAPRSFVLPLTPGELQDAAALVEPPPKPEHARVRVDPRPNGTWTVKVAARDRLGLLAMVSGVLADQELDVVRAHVATWLDGAAVEVFEVRGDHPLSDGLLGDRLTDAVGQAAAVRAPPGRPGPLRRPQLAVAHRVRGRGARPTRVCSTSWPRPSPPPTSRSSPRRSASRATTPSTRSSWSPGVARS